MVLEEIQRIVGVVASFGVKIKLTGREPLRSCLTGVNVSLDTQEPETHKLITGTTETMRFFRIMGPS